MPKAGPLLGLGKCTWCGQTATIALAKHEAWRCYRCGLVRYFRIIEAAPAVNRAGEEKNESANPILAEHPRASTLEHGPEYTGNDPGDYPLFKVDR